MIRKTVHSYSKVFDGNFGQVRDTIILETSWLGSSEPASKGQIASFIYEMMMSREQADLAAEYGLLPFDVSVLAAERTLCEKIMSLVRFSYTENPVRDLRSKIRHVYDLHQMLAQDDLPDFSIRRILSRCYIRSRGTINKVSETIVTGFTSILRRPWSSPIWIGFGRTLSQPTMGRFELWFSDSCRPTIWSSSR
jgi:hypothetical protein